VAPLKRLIDDVLRSAAQVFFAEHRVAGLLVVCAAFARPWGGLLGVLSAGFAVVLARHLRFSEEAAARGLFGFNALFLGLGVGAWFEPGMASVMTLLLTVPAVVLTQVGLATALGHHLALPSMTIPFVIIGHAVLLASPLIGGLTPTPNYATDCALPLASAGAVLFAPGPLGGALALLAIAVASRVALLLAGVGLLAAELAARTLAPCALAGPEAAFNALLTAVALGGVWSVPSRSAFVFAGLGALTAAFATYALGNLLAVAGLPVLVLPFNLTTLGLLYALRQRTRNAAPTLVDAPAASPEANLARHVSRVSRLGATLPFRLSLPFQGTWTVTQGVDGAFTHVGSWRHALDFEVLDRDGRAFRDAGTSLADYHAYRLPVLAPADGRVVRVVRDADDNPPGERSASDPWGNLVLLELWPGCYALLCHLAKGSPEVEEGQRVRRGARLGLCGASGRSFVPHLHLHLQATPQPGAPTIELELHDVVVEDELGPFLHRTLLPREGQRARNPLIQEDVAALFAWPPGASWRFEVDGYGPQRTETLTVGIDLRNTLHLASEAGERLDFARLPWLFEILDAPSPTVEGALALLALALRRVPWEAGHGLRWDDRVPRDLLTPRTTLRRALSGLVAPLWPDPGLRVTYRAERTERGLTVRGEATDLTCEAEVSAHGPERLSVTWRGVTRSARRLTQARA
jgi:urea transporter